MAGILSGLGSMLFGSGGGGYGVTGGKIGPAMQSTGGLLGSGGQFDWGRSLMTAGMGLGLGQAFGGSSVGSSILQKIPLSKGGKKLKTQLYETTQDQLLGRNLAKPFVKEYVSIYKGKLKKQAGELQKQTRSGISELTGRRVGTGAGLGGALSGIGGQIGAGAAPANWEAGFRRSEYEKGIAGAENIRNLELQTAKLAGTGDFTKQFIGQLSGAQQGLALGDLARYLMYLKYPPYQS
jgi:hypothetical protein